MLHRQGTVVKRFFRNFFARMSCLLRNMARVYLTVEEQSSSIVVGVGKTDHRGSAGVRREDQLTEYVTGQETLLRTSRLAHRIDRVNHRPKPVGSDQLEELQ